MVKSGKPWHQMTKNTIRFRRPSKDSKVIVGKVWLWVAAGYKALLPIITTGLGSMDHRSHAEPD